MSAFASSQWVWKNGRLIPWSEATIHLSAHGLHYGTGVFEGIRCYDTPKGPAIFRLDSHLERMFDSARTYSIEIPYSLEELTQACVEVVAANGFSQCYIRPIATFGSASLHVHPGPCPVEVAILAWPWGPYLGAAARENGIQVTVSRWKKFSSLAMPATAKACGQYLNSMLAVQDAVKRGFDEALLVDEDGVIAEGSGENLFMVQDGVVLTNDDRDHALMGITRDSVITLARDLGYKVMIGRMRREELEVADEAFFTGTAAEVTPISAVDHTAIGSGNRGPVTTELQRAFFAATAGEDRRHERWLTFVAERAAAADATASPNLGAQRHPFMCHPERRDHPALRDDRGVEGPL
jgi:branched-chain amino acid aminotransferase